MKLYLENKEMTPRDKRLLVFLAAIVALFVFGWCLLRPILHSNAEIKEEIRREQAVKQENDIKLAHLTTLKAHEQSRNEELSAVQDSFLPWIESQRIDAELTRLARVHGLTARSLTIHMPEEEMQSLSPYQNSDLARENAEDEQPQDTESGLYTASAAIELEGERDALNDYLTECTERSPSFRIVSFSRGTARVIEEGILREVDTLTLSLELYMIGEPK